LPQAACASATCSGRVAEARRQLGRAVIIRRGLYQREPKRAELAEELSFTLYWLVGAAAEAEVATNARAEVSALLAPFEQAGNITPRGARMLGRARGSE